jgi:hypothetical protein
MFIWVQGIATAIVGFVAITIVAALIHANVNELARHKGWDTWLTRAWPDMSRLRAAWWFWLAFGLAAGIAAPQWVGPLSSAPPVEAGVGKARRLSDDQMRRLVSEASKLRSAISAIPIAITNGDAETEGYAHDFADAFRRAGLQPQYTYTSPANSDETGVIICIKDINKPPGATERLRHALEEINVDPKILPCSPQRFANGYYDSSIMLYIAPHPL